MPLLFLSALLGGLATAMGSFVFRAVLALGIGTVTYTGLSVAVNTIKSSVVSSFAGMPADMVGLLAYLWVDKCLTIVFSAVVSALTMRLISGSVKKVVLK